MQLILAWVALPAVLIGVGAGWGVLVEKAIGRQVAGALLVSLGLLAALVVAALLTASAATAPAAVAAVAVGGAIGLAVAWPAQRIAREPLLMAFALLLVYGAPVILSGQATFGGYSTLDDTATWFGMTDQLFHHARSVDLSHPSTYANVIGSYMGTTGYPIGSFMLFGVGRGLVGIDAAWALQPYLALCGVLVGLAVYALFERFVRSAFVRAALAFVAAQPALLYGFSLWGGIKELTAAWVLIVGIALVEPYIGRGAPHPREALVLALPAAALALVLGAGAVVWIAAPLALVAFGWIRAARRARSARALLTTTAALVVVTLLLALPELAVVSKFLATDDVLFGATSGPSTGASAHIDRLGTLLAPLSPFQLAGVWPVDDFRRTAPLVPTAILVAVVLAGAIAAIVTGVRRGRPAIALYVTTAVLGLVAVELAGATPWVAGKALAIGAPAVLAAGVLGGGLLLGRSRAAGILVCGLIAGGVLWSNVLAYSGVTLAPRPRLAELERIGTMIQAKGPTLFNEYELYGTLHFLRAGDPTTPADFRMADVLLRGGERLIGTAHADPDSFPLQTLLRYRSIVTFRSPTQSRPPSSYRLVWRGRWYELWQRPQTPEELRYLPLEHISGGDSNVLPYCGLADKGQRQPCSVIPASAPPCSFVRQLGTRARRARGRLLAFERPPPIVIRASAARVPHGWGVDGRSGAVTPAAHGTMRIDLAIAAAGRYDVWLGGALARPVELSVDGRSLGRVWGPRIGVASYEPARTIRLTAGRHTLSLSLAAAGLRPGGRAADTVLYAVALDPLDAGRPQMLDVAPARAASLCGRPLDWIELVRPNT